jgi:hypothetical protein
MAFNIKDFKNKSFNFIAKLKRIINEEKTEKVSKIKVELEFFINNEFSKLHTEFINLLKQDSKIYYSIVPIATTIANFERLVDVIMIDCGNNTIEEMSEKIPERFFDLEHTITLFENQITKFSL